MRAQDIHEALRTSPFQPFRIQLTNGQAHEIRHREFAAVSRSSIYVGLSSGADEIPDQYVQCDLLHVVAIEPINGVESKPK